VTLIHWPLLRSRVAYIFSPRLAWVFVLIVVVSVALVLRGSEPWVRWCGLLLQLVGVWAVFKELRQAQHRHGLGFEEWWRKFLQGWPRRSVSLRGDLRGESHATGELKVSWSITAIDPSASPEVRLRVLEEHAHRFLKDIDRIEGDVAATRKAALDAVAEEAQKRDQALAVLEAEARAGDEQRIPFSLFGAACLFLGIILGTGSAELIKWAQ
jgi:hypothetical protein